MEAIAFPILYPQKEAILKLKLVWGLGNLGFFKGLSCLTPKLRFWRSDSGSSYMYIVVLVYISAAAEKQKTHSLFEK